MSAPILDVPAAESETITRAAKLAVLVATLGYLVDIYDLILFGVVRTDSLRGIGVTDVDGVGQQLISIQMLGMLVGGIVWGVLGDRRGRISVLFGSIVMYSLANIANGFVEDVATYKVLRFVAGVGLAGELGAGVTLTMELLPARARGYATTIIAGIGICGAMLAVAVGKLTDWRTAYFIGGALGLLLLALRVGVVESGLFARSVESGISRGNFLQLFTNGNRLRRYLGIVVVGMPVWFSIGIAAAFSNQVGGAGMSPGPDPAWALGIAYAGLAVGDFASGLLSQVVRSRKKALLTFLLLNVAALTFYFTIGRGSVTLVYTSCFLLGIANGYWAVFVTVAAEQFGTNLRATAATTAPNFVRGSLALQIAIFQALVAATGSAPQAAAITGGVVAALALGALLLVDETYGQNLDFDER